MNLHVYKTYILQVGYYEAVCVGIMHMVFSGTSKGTHTAPTEIFKLIYPFYVQSSRPLFRTYLIIHPAYKVCMVYIFRRFNHRTRICMCLCILVNSSH